MLIPGLSANQTFYERKAWLLDYIRVSRGLIRMFDKIQQKYPEMADECTILIEREQEDIRETIQEIIDLERWRAQKDIPKDERFTEIKL